MNTPNPFLRFRRQKTVQSNVPQPVFRASVPKNLDRKLLQQARVSYLPSFKQLRYVGRFLSIKEKRLVRILIFLSTVTLLASSAFFAYQHIEKTPAEGGEYSEGFVGQPAFLNPLFSSTSEIDSDAVALLYSGLFRYNERRELVPDLAATHKISDDFRIYDITLKPNLLWSDGKPITAHDVVFTFESIQNPEVGSPLAPAFQGVKIEKINELTVRFTLKQAFAPFIHTLTTGIIPEHVWGAIDNPAHLKLAKTNLEPIGSGPWQYSRLVKRDGGGIETLSLTPNPYYHGNRPYIKKFTFHFYADQSNLLDALKTRKILAVSFPPRFTSSTLKSKITTSYPIELPQYTALFFNLDLNPFLKDKKIRTALSAAINKQTIIEDGLFSAGLLIESPILPGMIGYLATTSPSTTTLDMANNLLDTAWLRIQPEEYFKIRSNELKKERVNPDTKNQPTSNTLEIDETIYNDVQKEMSPTQTFYRRDKKNQLLRLTISTVDTPEYVRVANIIAENWQSLGVQTTVKPISRQFFLRNVIKNRDYDAILYGEIVGGDPDPFPFWHSSQSNYPGLNLSLYSNRTVDRLLEEGRTTTDIMTRQKIYTAFQENLLADYPAVFLYTPLYNMLISSDVKNVTIPPLVVPSHRYTLFEKWYIKTHWKWK